MLRHLRPDGVDTQVTTHGRIALVPDKVILVGERGGRYYLNAKGNPVYLKADQRAKCDDGRLRGVSATSTHCTPR
jgi:hypothetical protein